jgi:hypothetical protein
MRRTGPPAWLPAPPFLVTAAEEHGSQIAESAMAPLVAGQRRLTGRAPRGSTLDRQDGSFTS